MRRLGVVVLLAALAASFGWIMVASGLIDRPWVNAYKLTAHLALGITLFSYLLWITLKVNRPRVRTYPQSVADKLRWPLNILLGVQLLLGGVMSGAKAALPYPTWPDMNGKFIPSVLRDGSAWTVENLVYYEQSFFQPALFQFLHRMTAYALAVMVLYFAYRCWASLRTREVTRANVLLVSLLIIQVGLGIATVVNSIGQVPVGLGVAHQFTAIALVGTVVYLNYLIRPGRPLHPVEKAVENLG
jgi:cytochrome c oxidase assembly protein subunit 15